MIINLNDLTETAIFREGTEQRIVGLTSGCFDLFHTKHLTYLERCRRLCDVLVVGVDCDELVQISKGPKRPIIPEHQRVAMVDNQKHVAASFIMATVNDFRRAVAIFGAKYIFKNQDFEPKTNGVVGANLADLIIVPDTTALNSTTEIIERAIENEVAISEMADGLTEA